MRWDFLPTFPRHACKINNLDSALETLLACAIGAVIGLDSQVATFAVGGCVAPIVAVEMNGDLEKIAALRLNVGHPGCLFMIPKANMENVPPAAVVEAELSPALAISGYSAAKNTSPSRIYDGIAHRNTELL